MAKKQSKGLKAAHRVRKCLKEKFGHKNKEGKRVGPKKPTLKQRGTCGSKTAKAKLKARGKR